MWVQGNTSGNVGRVLEAEHALDATTPLYAGWNTSSGAIDGATELGVPSQAIVTAVYAAQASNAATTATLCTQTAIQGRGWTTDPLTAISGLDAAVGVSAAPTARLLAMRCLAEALDLAVPARVYLEELRVSGGTWVVG